MKTLLLLCALVGAVPALAQNKDKDAPKELGFNFGFQYSPETRVTSAKIGYQRLIPSAQPAVFDETVTGKNGVIESETISFLNPNGAVLGTLSSSFDGSGHLKTQSLTQGNSPPRALDWLARGTQSPILTLEKSIVSARYTLQNGFLKARVLNIQLPTGAREIKTDYDALGRREHDASVSAKGAADFRFLYDKKGLTTFRGSSGPDDKPFEGTISRTRDGQIAQFSVKTDGVLSYRATPSYNEKGESQSMRMENFEGGVLANAFTMSQNNKRIEQEEYNEGVIASRKTQNVGEKGAVQMVRLEEFDQNGRLAQRTEYNKDGAVSAVTTFNADGSVKSTRKFDAGN